MDEETHKKACEQSWPGAKIHVSFETDEALEPLLYILPITFLPTPRYVDLGVSIESTSTIARDPSQYCLFACSDSMHTISSRSLPASKT